MSENKVRDVAKVIKAALLEQAANGSPNIDCEAMARAAIKAMREPTRDMCAKGGAAIDGLPDDDPHDGFSTAAAAFHAMIDAALNEQVGV